MSTLRTRYAPALFSVGGQHFRLVELTPTHVRLENPLDGHCLSFTLDEAFRMLVQQDLTIVGPPVLQEFAQTLAEMVDPPKPTARQPTMSPNHAAAKYALRINITITITINTVQRHCRCTTPQQGDHERLARLGDRPTQRVRSIILDEFSRCQPSDALTRAQSLARLKVDAQALKLCPDCDGSGRAMPQPPQVGDHPASEDRWLSEGRSRTAPTAPGGYRLKKRDLALITAIDVAPGLRAVARPQAADGISRHARVAAAERAASRWPTVDRGRKPAQDTEVGDVE